MKKIFIILGVAVVVLSGFWYFRGGLSVMSPPPLGSDGGNESGWKTYSSSRLGLSFRYPSSYYLEEQDFSTGERDQYSIILTEDTEENRAVREGRAPGREGPTAITIDIFQNNLDRLSAQQWIETTNATNFKLATGPLATTTLGGEAAFSFPWDGLYPGESVVAVAGDWFYVISVTFLTHEDQILRDFLRILETLWFAKS